MVVYLWRGTLCAESGGIPLHSRCVSCLFQGKKAATSRVELLPLWCLVCLYTAGVDCAAAVCRGVEAHCGSAEL